MEAGNKKELEHAEQKGYDFCFEEQLASMQRIQGKLFQAGYDHGLDAILVPPTSSLRTAVSIPQGFKYASEGEDEVDDDVKSSMTGDLEGVQEPLAVGDIGVQVGGGVGGATVVDDVEDTVNHDPAIHVD